MRPHHGAVFAKDSILLQPIHMLQEDIKIVLRTVTEVVLQTL
jgi:hypothetical protein